MYSKNNKKIVFLQKIHMPWLKMSCIQDMRNDLKVIYYIFWFKFIILYLFFKQAFKALCQKVCEESGKDILSDVSIIYLIFLCFKTKNISQEREKSCLGRRRGRKRSFINFIFLIS